ncbi:MAG: hypothetical protein HY330_07420, partial [Chloroflexi bacterium]|nr:hypothetical protein [Chloroflexota bacterium]
HHLRALAEAGLVRLGGCGDGDLAAVRGAILSLLADPEARAAMSAAGQRLVDGQGALRVARAILAEVGGGGRPQGLPS